MPHALDHSLSNVVIWGLTAAGGLYAIAIHDYLARLRFRIRDTWGAIDRLLAQRQDDVARLVDLVRSHLRQEPDAVTRLLQACAASQNARRAGHVTGVGQAERGVRQGLMQLFALAEAHPELKADQEFQQLQARISGFENRIADHRERYNADVIAFNTRRARFPDLLVARVVGFRAVAPFDDQPPEAGDVGIQALFG